MKTVLQQKLSHCYEPPCTTLWSSARPSKTTEYIYQQVKPLDLTSQLLPKEGMALLGFACDKGIEANHGRLGAALGPKAIRQALASKTLQENHHYPTIWDMGDIHCHQQGLTQSQEALQTFVTVAHRQNLLTCLLGGGHEIAYGHYMGLQQAYPEHTIGIINFDAHFDLRGNATGSIIPTSGTPFWQMAKACQDSEREFRYAAIGIQPFANSKSLIQRAHDLDVMYYTAENIFEEGIEMVKVSLDNFIEQVDLVYLTVCMDVFDTSFAPGVSAPNPLGLAPRQVLPLIEYITRSGKCLAMDVAETSPTLDRDNQTAALAAHCLLSAWHAHPLFNADK